MPTIYICTYSDLTGFLQWVLQMWQAGPLPYAVASSWNILLSNAHAASSLQSMLRCHFLSEAFPATIFKNHYPSSSIPYPSFLLHLLLYSEWKLHKGEDCVCFVQSYIHSIKDIAWHIVCVQEIIEWVNNGNSKCILLIYSNQSIH